MSILSQAAFALMLLYLLLLVCKLLLGRLYVARQDASFRGVPLSPADASRTSIAQPILGGDPLLRETLAENVGELPKEIEFLWLVDEDDSVGRQVAELIAEDHSNIRVIDCPPSEGTKNPKAFKLQIALNQCEREYFVVLDDDTVLPPESLVAALRSLGENSLYTGLPMYRSAKNLWGNLVSQFVNSNSVLTYLPPLVFFSPISINGMFYAVRSEQLRELGGFTAIVEDLCDDYAMHSLFSENGLRVHQGISVQVLSTSVQDWRRYWLLMHRWFVFALKLIPAQPLPRKIVLVLMLGLPANVLAAAMVLSLFSWQTMLAMAMTLVLRYLLQDLAKRTVFAPKQEPRPVLSVIAEVLQPIQTLFAFLYPTIRWRKHLIRVGQGQAFEIVDSTK